MSTLELPAPAVRLEDTEPCALLAHNAALGYFASAPQRLAPHLALAVHPDQSRSIDEIASELTEAAGMADELTDSAVERIRYRLDGLLGRGQLLEDVRYTERTGLGKRAHNEAGSAITPLATLLAARWLVARESTETLLPKSVTRRIHHGTRISILQHCLEGEANIKDIAADLGFSVPVAKRYFVKFTNEGWVTRSSGYHAANYTVVEDAHPLVASWAAELHSLSNDGYCDTLRTEVLPGIVRDPQLYGALARAALTGILETKRSRVYRRRVREE